jgi:uncharacterized damage-inducible protein DinB
MRMRQKANGSTGEAAEEYRERLASYVEGEDPVSIQRQSPTQLSTLIAGLSAEQLTSRPAEGKWSIIEILTHLADDEIATYWRYRQMIEHDGVPLSGFDQELWAMLGSYQSWGSDEALALFRLLRNANLRMLESLSPEQWERSGNHAERGRLTVADLARHMAAHDINHLRQIESLLPIEH